MAYSIVIYDTKGKKIGTESLTDLRYNDDAINTDLMHEYFLLQRSNARVAIAHTKTRGEVKWSGKKLYRQKGTGNARVWDKKSPLRKKGWVAFGPRSTRNFSKTMPKKMRRAALLSLVSTQAKEWVIVWLNGFSVEKPKTKYASSVLSSLSLADTKTLVVSMDKDLTLMKSFSNLPKAKCILASYLNPCDLLHVEKIVLLEWVVDYLNTL